MKQRYWIMVIVFGMALGVSIGVSQADVYHALILVVSILGGLLLCILYPVLGDEREDKQIQKRLLKENKYQKRLTCNNCGDRKTYEISKGVCMVEFFSAKKCSTCDCDLKASLADIDAQRLAK